MKTSCVNSSFSRPSKIFSRHECSYMTRLLVYIDLCSLSASYEFIQLLLATVRFVLSNWKVPPTATKVRTLYVRIWILDWSLVWDLLSFERVNIDPGKNFSVHHFFVNQYFVGSVFVVLNQRSSLQWTGTERIAASPPRFIFEYHDSLRTLPTTLSTLVETEQWRKIVVRFSALN